MSLAALIRSSASGPGTKAGLVYFFVPARNGKVGISFSIQMVKTNIQSLTKHDGEMYVDNLLSKLASVL